MIIKENKIQCMECKNYYHYISPSHLKKCCNLTCKEYKEKYPNNLMRIISEESNKKRSKTLKGKKFTENHCKNISKGLTGRKLSEETKQKQSISAIKLYENGYIQPMKGKKHSEESCKKRSESHKGLKHSEETKQKQRDAKLGKKYSEQHCKNISLAKRISRIKEVKEKNGYIYPNYNPKACEIFDWFNKEFNLNGYHALNGGEYHIKELGYFLDYYETDLNLVIEFDEKHHYNFDGSLKEKDKIRENEIKKFLKCRFIRIKGENYEKIKQNREL